MEKLNDLRFLIGLFFALTGAILVVLAFAIAYETAQGKYLNLVSGLCMLIFGLFMLGLSRRNG